MILCIRTLINYLLKKNNYLYYMRRNINIVRIQPLYTTTYLGGDDEKKIKSDLEKPKKYKKDTNENKIKFIHF